MSENDDNLRQIAVLQSELKWLREAITIQAKEYERRLTELNHAHARATNDAAKFVTAELFFSKLDELIKWRSEMDQWRSRIIGIAIGIGAMAGAAGGLVTRVLFGLGN